MIEEMYAPLTNKRPNT